MRPDQVVGQKMDGVGQPGEKLRLELGSAVVGGQRHAHQRPPPGCGADGAATRPRKPSRTTRRPIVATASAVNPNSRRIVPAGADAPKWSRATIAPSSPVQRSQPSETPSSTATRFLAAASHDLRQPLHAMGLFAEALRQRSHDPEVASLVNSINESVDALEGLFGELLDITRIDTGLVFCRRDDFNAIGGYERQIVIEPDPQKLSDAGVGFDQLDPRILPEMAVKVAFRETGGSTTAASRVVIVPKSAIRQQDGRDVVLLVQNGSGRSETYRVNQ